METVKNENHGTIYKITNLINNKVYIGQTKQNYLVRFVQHKSHARTGQSNHKLANALRKYGEENFIIEPIENCSYEQLDERESYWIAYYDSTNDNNGYNIKTGGKTNSLFYELENEQEIIDYYYKCHNQLETIKKFNITEYKFRQLLAKNNLPTDYTNYGKHIRKKIFVVELNLEFDSEVDCAKYFIENNICQTKKEQCARVRIANAVRNNKNVITIQLKKYKNYMNAEARKKGSMTRLIDEFFLSSGCKTNEKVYIDVSW